MTRLEFGFANGANQGLFDLGVVVGTPEAVDTLRRAGVSARELLQRHHRGDWGEIDEEDRGLNETALEQGLRIMSVYHLPRTEDTIWIITDWDRAATTILTPGDY